MWSPGDRLSPCGVLRQNHPITPEVPIIAATLDPSELDSLRELSPRLGQIVSALLQLPVLESHSVGSILRGVDLDFDAVRKFVRFDPQNYVRSLVFRDERFEVRLLCWRQGHASSLHGHGTSSCAFRVVRGAMTEIVLGGRDRKHPPGTVIEETDGRRVHQAMNLEPDPLISLHVYAPPMPVDQPSARSGDDFVVVGGGFSGAAVAYHLLKLGREDVRVNLIERGPFIGRGIAYGMESEVFLLNVPASRMSIDPEIPDDFVDFAGARAAPHAFLPRAVFGQYVADRLARMVSQSRGKLRVIRDEAVAVRADAGGGGEVELRNGDVRRGRSVIISTGMTPRLPPHRADPLVVDAWDECALSALPKEGRLLVLGSGLSALDVVSWLDHLGFRGTLRIVSPRGLLPLLHGESGVETAAYSAAEMAALPRGLRERFRWVKGEIAAAQAGGRARHSVAEALRPHVETLYRTLSDADRARFIRHVRPYWEVLRHRAPRESLLRIEQWRRAARLDLTAGRVIAEARSADGVFVTVRRRDGSVFNEWSDRIVRCVGPALALDEQLTPLTQSLLANRLAMRDPSGLGLATDPHGRFVEPTGGISPFLYGMGAVRRASGWEGTSVPDIRVQAQELAQRCLG